VGRDGTFELRCGPGHWIIKAARTVDDVVAQGEVELESGGSAQVVLRSVDGR
jgi:hypothetical protein